MREGDADAAEDDVDGHAGPLPRPAEVGLPLPRGEPPGTGLPGTGAATQQRLSTPLGGRYTVFELYKISNSCNPCGGLSSRPPF